MVSPELSPIPETAHEMEVSQELLLGKVATAYIPAPRRNSDAWELRQRQFMGEAPDDDLLAWQKDALCAQADPEAFHPEKGGSTREAKRICVGCDVKTECLEYALTNRQYYGIWGGLSERERRRLLRELA